MKIQLTEDFQFLFRPKRFKIMFGGRYGMKTTAAIRGLLYQGAKDKLRILGCREFMKSIEASVHEAMCGEIDKLNMHNLYTPYKTQIEGSNGTSIRYTGLARDPKGIKSTYELDRALLEEGESVSEKSLNDLIPTIIREPGAELWIVFNPEDEFSPVWQRFVAPHIDEIKSKGHYEDDRLYIIKTNYWENPFLSDAAYEEAELCKVENYRQWLWQYAGELYADFEDAIIKPEWVEASINAHERLGFKPLGVKSQGFDLADTGDAKATMQRHGSVITTGDRWTVDELPEAIDRAFQSATNDEAEYMVYDDDGLGKAMKVYLANVNISERVEVVPYNGNDSVDNPGQIYDDKTKKTNKEIFRNKRAQYHWYLRDRFEATYNAIDKGIYTDPDTMISLSPDIKDLPILKSELVKIKRKRGQNSFIQIESKEDMKKRGVKSPNMSDALVMCFANPAPKAEAVNIEFDSEF